MVDGQNKHNNAKLLPTVCHSHNMFFFKHCFPYVSSLGHVQMTIARSHTLTTSGEATMSSTTAMLMVMFLQNRKHAPITQQGKTEQPSCLQLAGQPPSIDATKIGALSPFNYKEKMASRISCIFEVMDSLLLIFDRFLFF